MKIKIENTNDLFFELDVEKIQKDDTLFLTIDPYYIDIDIADKIAKSLINTFPENNVICKLKGMEISIK